MNKIVAQMKIISPFERVINLDGFHLNPLEANSWIENIVFIISSIIFKKFKPFRAILSVSSDVAKGCPQFLIFDAVLIVNKDGFITETYLKECSWYDFHGWHFYDCLVTNIKCEEAGTNYGTVDS